MYISLFSNISSDDEEYVTPLSSRTSSITCLINENLPLTTPSTDCQLTNEQLEETLTVETANDELQSLLILQDSNEDSINRTLTEERSSDTRDCERVVLSLDKAGIDNEHRDESLLQTETHSSSRMKESTPDSTDSCTTEMHAHSLGLLRTPEEDHLLLPEAKTVVTESPTLSPEKPTSSSPLTIHQQHCSSTVHHLDERQSSSDDPETIPKSSSDDQETIPQPSSSFLGRNNRVLSDSDVLNIFNSRSSPLPSVKHSDCVYAPLTESVDNSPNCPITITPAVPTRHPLYYEW